MKRKISVLLFSLCLLLVMVTLLVFTACSSQGGTTPAPGASAPAAGQAAKQTITLKVASALPEVLVPNKPFFIFRDLVNQRASGALQIQYLGGPEVVAVGDQAMSVQKKVIDMGYAYSAAYVGMVPGADGFTFSNISLSEERSRGVYDYIQPQYAKNNLFLLGRCVAGEAGKYFYVASTKPIKQLADFKGLKIGGISPAYIHFLPSLGASPIVFGPPDAYTSLERGVVDGIWLPLNDHIDFGLIEKEKYVVDHGFGSDNHTVYMNLDVWKSLPKNLQDLLTQALIDAQAQFDPQIKQMYSGDAQKLKDKGIQFVTFSSDEAKKYVDSSASEEWKDISSKNPEIGAKLRQLLTK